MAQINALTTEKLARTAVQRKMSSQLVYAVKMARGEAIAPGVTTLRATLPDVNQQGAVLDVRADVSPSLLDRLRALGAELLEVSAVYRNVRIRVSLGQVEAIAALPDVAFVMPKQEFLTSRLTPFDRAPIPTPERRGDLRQQKRVSRAELLSSVQQAVDGGFVTNVGSKNSEGDVTHRASVVRATFGHTGVGVKIGVLSDGVSSLASSQAAGDLGPVTVLTNQAGSGDEGTAMLEIIHDLAPGAQLYFATGTTGLATFAQNIHDLAAAGCHIIVDDISYFVESPFQDGQLVTSQYNGGIVAQAVKDVANTGVLYFSSAANSGNKNDNQSGTWEGDFVSGGAPTGPLAGFQGTVHNFGGQTYNQLLVDSAAVTLFWSDPTSGAANDYDLYILNNAGTAVVDASADPQTGSQDPFEGVGAPLAGERIVILLYSGAGRFLHLNTNRSRLQISTAGNTHGHAATTAPNSFGVAATPAQSPGPYPGGFNAGHKVETFSSDGPRRIFFAANGAPFTPNNYSSTGGIVLQKPDFTAADGVSVTGAGGFPSTFYGTSAAAPHAAAIAALVRSRNRLLSAGQVRAALISTAIDIEAPGVDRDSGYGILMADLAVAAVVRGQRTDGDFDGDSRADLTVFRPSNGTWYSRSIGSGAASGRQWGNSSDVPVPGDYDGDGRTDIAVFRPSNGTWYIVFSSTGAATGVQWGNSTDVPVPGDYDLDRRTDVAVFRPSNGTWYIVFSSTGTAAGFQWGNSTDLPVPSDYDGDARTDIAVFRPSNGTWYVVFSSTGAPTGFQWGNSNDVPVPGDYDGDGRADIAVFRPSNGTWYLVPSRTGTPSGIQWGNATDVPVPGDYDGDGLTDVAVFRPSNGTWYVVYSSTGTAEGFQWGTSTDKPVLKRP